MMHARRGQVDCPLVSASDTNVLHCSTLLINDGGAYCLGMRPSTALGLYLRARRELIRPEEAGLPTSGRRRVPGLRREELAMLAGISADYYLRLEQGRENHPSEQVIEALARALRLDEGATAHLHALARPTPTKRRPAERERAPASIEQLIASWPQTPAFVWGRHMDILAANALVTAISPVFSPGVNLVRATFLDPEVRRLVDDWEEAARSTVARLRALVGPDVENPDLAALVSELSEQSEPFRRLWARHDIQIAPIATRTFHHPIVGPLDLKPERLAIIGTEGQVLIVYHAEAGSRSARALARLAGLIGATKASAR